MSYYFNFFLFISYHFNIVPSFPNHFITCSLYKPWIFKVSCPFPGIEQRILAYAMSLEKSGVWLDYLDAGLCAGSLDNRLHLLIHTQNAFEIADIQTFVKQFSGIDLGIEETPLRRDCAKTWVLLSCNALFDCGKDAAKNHWIPCVFKEQLDAEEYDELTIETRRKCVREVTALQKQMAKHLTSQDADAVCESLEIQRQEPLDL